MKPGWKTTEFGATVGVALAMFAVASHDGDPWVRVVSLVSAAAVVVAYAAFRTKAKQRGPLA